MAQPLLRLDCALMDIFVRLGSVGGSADEGSGDPGVTEEAGAGTFSYVIALLKASAEAATAQRSAARAAATASAAPSPQALVLPLTGSDFSRVLALARQGLRMLTGAPHAALSDALLAHFSALPSQSAELLDLLAVLTGVGGGGRGGPQRLRHPFLTPSLSFPLPSAQNSCLRRRARL